MSPCYWQSYFIVIPRKIVLSNASLLWTKLFHRNTGNCTISLLLSYQQSYFIVIPSEIVLYDGSKLLKKFFHSNIRQNFTIIIIHLNYWQSYFIVKYQEKLYFIVRPGKIVFHSNTRWDWLYNAYQLPTKLFIVIPVEID